MDNQFSEPYREDMQSVFGAAPSFPTLDDSETRAAQKSDLGR